jgi:hypothetical protein
MLLSLEVIGFLRFMNVQLCGIETHVGSGSLQGDLDRKG